MPKKILFESAVHQFLWAGSRLRQRLGAASAEDAGRLATWLNALQIENPVAGQLRVSWPAPARGEHVVEFKAAKFYTRGDTAAHAQQQQERGLVAAEDRVMSANMAFFDDALRTTLVHARVFDEA
ncbi:MAG: hypothetical protein ABIZ49_08270, partial [Opitutaceae bacterium]